jgi:hemoglobin-like flavoprotein
MLSDKSRPVVQATLPVVAENIQQIAGRFYQHMFDAHPELLDGLFNRGNQVEGAQQQALAGSIAAFASALVNTPDHLPEHLLSRIAHKHHPWESVPTSTRSSTTTSCGPSATFSGMPSRQKSPPRGTRSTG